MMIVFRTPGELYNPSRLEISPLPNDSQQRIQKVEKELKTILWSEPSKPYISSSLILTTNEPKKNPKIRVFNIEN